MSFMQDLPQLPPQLPVQTTPLIAPLWHTVAFLLLLATWASISAQRTHDYTNTPHLATYLSMMMMTWMLFGTTVAGIRDRAAFFFATLRHRAVPFSTEVGRGIAIYLGVYGSAIVIAMVVATATLSYKSLHHAMPSSKTQTASHPNSAVPVPPPIPTSAEPISARTTSKFHFNSRTVLAIAPRTPLEVLLWLAISATAGFCEEHIFRGYLLQQALAFTRRAGLSSLLATTLSVIATSLIFGSLHLYEGLGGAALITVLGAVYAVVALKLGNLRAVIVAHFLQDAVAGFFLFAYHSLHIP